jgi:general secretion pathway protein A
MSYYRILGLHDEPFSTSPDPSYFFLSAQHKAALTRLRIALSLKRGLSVIVGDVGTGKTTLSRKLSQILREEPDVCFHMILNPYFKTQKQFLSRLVSILHAPIDPKKTTGLDCIEAIEQFLYKTGVQEKKRIVLLIDEAQLLPDYVLEILRILLNYETNEYKILQLVLVGQMELVPVLSRMPNFWDRIALKCVINPLDLAEAKELIQFRLHQAGYQGDGLFAEGAIRLIHQHTKGYPRQMSMMCHNLLEMLVMRDCTIVDETLVREAITNELRPHREAPVELVPTVY